jgi:hypothetical protein
MIIEFYFARNITVYIIEAKIKLTILFDNRNDKIESLRVPTTGEPLRVAGLSLGA